VSTIYISDPSDCNKLLADFSHLTRGIMCNMMKPLPSRIRDFSPEHTAVSSNGEELVATFSDHLMLNEAQYTKKMTKLLENP